MKLRLLDPNKGYRKDYLWLPKSRITNAAGLKSALSFPQDQAAPIAAWFETKHHLVVPREFIPFSGYDKMPFEIEDHTPTDFPAVDLKLTHSLRGPHQRLGWAEMVENGNGVLSLPCGGGKTVVSIHTIAASKMPGLVVVHNVDLLHQWRERFTEHTNLTDSDIGWIQGKKWDWEKPVAIATIQTLAGSADKIPVEFRRHFGSITYDEVHHLGAPWFNTTAPLCFGNRWGLSATWKREDGMENLFLYHLGPVLYETREQDITPECWFVPTGVSIPDADYPALRNRSGKIHDPHLLTWLAESDDRNKVILDYLDDAIKDDRKVLVLSQRVEHLKFLHSQYNDAGLIHGDVKGEERKRVLDTYNLIFGSTQLAKEGLDRRDLDTVFICLPFSAEGQLRQIIGRTQRHFEGKQQPVVIIFEDEKIPQCKKKCQKLRHHLTSFQYPYRTAG